MLRTFSEWICADQINRSRRTLPGIETISRLKPMTGGPRRAVDLEQSNDRPLDIQVRFCAPYFESSQYAVVHVRL
jgi:hypothetical protein